jgi:Fe-S-cluster containining protein
MDVDPLPAGRFSTWLAGMQDALRGEADSDVPCDGCTACCTSSQFVHIGPGETDTLAHIPSGLLFPAPRLPRGNVLLGYDENGHCPMLVDGRCSIYEHRPQTCRTYDCRIFPATGIEPDEDGKEAIAHRARRWRFDHPEEVDQIEQAALRAAARYVRERGDDSSATRDAVLAVQVHDLFLHQDGESGRTVVVEPEPEVVRERLNQSERPAGRRRGRGRSRTS